MPFSVIVLIYTDYFQLPLLNRNFIYATSASVVLGVFGTAVATIMFYELIKNAGVVFSSMVTYGVPFIALGWGLFAGDHINPLQITGLLIILGGVSLTNIKRGRDESRS
jgi:drug/metabolite transporter (DMT)-like permease